MGDHLKLQPEEARPNTVSKKSEIRFISRSIVRFVASLFLAVIAAYALSLFFYRQITASMIELRKQELRRLVTLGENAISPILDELASGAIGRDAALDRVRDRVRLLVYDDPATRNYLFMSSYDGEMLVQPFEPQMEGTDQWDLQDSRGRYIIRELVAAARSGSGFVEYYYPPPDRQGPERKISYVVGIDELNAYLGTGLYLYDLRTITMRFFRNSSIAVSAVFLILVLMLVLLFKPYYTAYHNLLERFSFIADNPDQLARVPVDPAPPNSEVGLLMHNFTSMLAELELARGRLEKSLNEKKVLLQEVHHRVKNNLQIVSSLLNLQSSLSSDPADRQIFEDSILRIHSMALVHELVYGSDTFDTIAMEEYLNSVAQSVFQSQMTGDVQHRLRFQLEEATLDIDRAISLGLILTELTTNALKHAFVAGKAGRVTVAYEQEEGIGRLTVDDDGRGAPPDLIESAFDSGSLGITLIRALAAQLEGELLHESSPGGGSRFTVSFPL